MRKLIVIITCIIIFETIFYCNVNSTHLLNGSWYRLDVLLSSKHFKTQKNSAVCIRTYLNLLSSSVCIFLKMNIHTIHSHGIVFELTCNIHIRDKWWMCACKRAEAQEGNGKRVALGNNCLTRFQPAPGASINRRVAAGTNYMPTFLVTPFAYICRVWQREVGEKFLYFALAVPPTCFAPRPQLAFADFCRVPPSTVVRPLRRHR